ncbi:MAG TPA: ATP-binding protein [Kofleriaceae bacterium]|nr:ATP-binding protein [Kofleriaceae bacterium]
MGTERPESLTTIPAPTARAEVERRVIYLMLFRLVLITLVLGATALLWWLGDADLASWSALLVFGVIAMTYLATVIYAIALRRGANLNRLINVQLAGDVLTATLLVHVTGGAGSAYTFFYPMAIVGAATVRFRSGAMSVAVASVAFFIASSLLAWLGVLPAPSPHGVSGADLSAIELARALGLNLAAFAGVAFLAVNLGQQLQRTVASLESEREAAADLYALHEDIVRCLSSGLVTVDARDRVLTINQVACEILETAPGASVGRPVDQVLPGLAAKLEGLPARDSLRRDDLVVRLGARSLVLGLSISPLRDNQDRVIGRVLNFQDLTDLRKMEKQVQHAERLAAIGTLAAGVAHEIRNPLAAISGSIELLRSAPDEDNRPLMDIITREIDRLNRMIGDLLDYANPGPREFVEFDFAELVHETLAVFARDTGLNEVTVQVAKGSLEHGLAIVGDPSKLKQVLWNLLRNAAEAARTGGGTVSVRVDRDRQDALVEVLDSGPGIDENHISHVFEPFFTTKKSGSGLGLATSHNIILEHGGTIRAESHEGQGARFVVRLPLDSSGTLDRQRGVPAESVQRYTRERDERS